MLDCGAEHFKLRHLDMPRNFFSGNNSVAEYGHFPSNFLLGVSTPSSEIQFRRQMLSRNGESITVAGNPPLKFASASFETEDKTHRPPNFPLFLTRVFLNDLFNIGMVPITEGLIFTILYICFWQFSGYSIFSAAIALILTEVNLVLLSIAIKKFLVGREWGTDHSTPFWSWRHFAYFFAQDCFFVWCRSSLSFCAGTILSNPILRWMGCRIGHRTIVTQPLQCFDWNAVSFGNDCVIDAFLQFHTFENMMLKVKQTDIRDGCAVNVGATLMGGATLEPDTTILPLSLVLKEVKLLSDTYEGSPAQAVKSDSTLSVGIDETKRSIRAPHTVDNTDWLKAAAIITVLIDHFGYFFMEDDLWWGAFGRLAAPTFFFLVGYAKTRRVPRYWIWLGVTLTLLDSWNADWTWVAPNILLSFALIRLVRPYVERFVQHQGWIGYVLLVLALLIVLPAAAEIVDYGAEGWLWALFGLCQSRYVERRSPADAGAETQGTSTRALAMLNKTGVMGVLLCLVTASVYIWQEQQEFSFPKIQLTVVIVGVGVLSVCLCLFQRGPSRIQPPGTVAAALGFIGRHTLEIYAVQLAVSELIVKFVPDLAP
jgi:TraX protein